MALMLLWAAIGYCQPTAGGTAFILTVLNEKAQPADGATVELLKDKKLVKAAIADAKGIARFENVADGTYTFSVTYTGYQHQISSDYQISGNLTSGTITLQPLNTALFGAG